jgi:hypothetical protein
MFFSQAEHSTMMNSRLEAPLMKTKDLMERVRFIVDPHGTQSGVLLNVEDWDQLLILLEDLEDAEEIQQARKTDEEEVSWEQAKAELGI